MKCVLHVSISITAILLCHCNIVDVDESTNVQTEKDNFTKNSEKVEVFKATNEWQTVKKGQPIPKGLHVRINLQTGETEAKLLSESESKRKDIVTVPDTMSSEHESEEDSKSEQIKESLLNLGSGYKPAVDDEDVKRVREKFRSYKELKDKFKEINMTVKTDLEVMSELLIRLKAKRAKREEAADDEVLAILTDLEYLVHQFDNAREFIRLGGFTDVVLPVLNATRFELRSGAAHVLGSAMQSNPKVQIAGLESGSMGPLLRAVAFDTSPVVRARALFALSCLVRNFPTAQDKLVKEGGLSVLAQLFDTDGQEEQNLQMKVITLLHDLISERLDTVQTLSDGSSSSKEELQEKLRQYQAIGLESKLVEQGWCSRITQLLTFQDMNQGRTNRRDDVSSAVTRDLPVRPEHDIVEKVVETMIAVADLCQEDFRKNDKLMRVILDLKEWYNQLATREDLDKESRKTELSSNPDENDDKQYYYYYSGLARLLDKLAEKLKLQVVRDEL